MKCPYCDKEVEQEGFLGVHILSKHEDKVDIDIDDSPKECPVCGKEMGKKNKQSVRMHVAFKHPEIFDFEENVNEGDVRERILNADSTYKREKIAYENETVAPKNAIIELTQICNLNCRHCAVSDMDNVVMEKEDAFGVLDKLRRMGIERLILEGGEPTMHPDFYQILEYATSRFREVNIQTNGTTDTNFSDYDCNVTVSFEYFNPIRNNEVRRMTDPDRFKYDKEVGLVYLKDDEEKVDELSKNITRVSKMLGEEPDNEKLKKKYKELGDEMSKMTRPIDLSQPVQGSEERSYRMALKKLKAIDNPKTLRATIYNDNNVLALAMLADSVGANSVFIPLKPVGLGENLKNKLPGKKKVREDFEKIVSFNSISKMNHKVEIPERYIARKELWESNKDLFTEVRGKVCSSGQYRLFVNVHGDVTPCLLLPNEKMGNIFKESIQNIYNNLYEWSQEAVEKSKEKSCEKCMGGCMASLLANEEMSENPCIFKKGGV